MLRSLELKGLYVITDRGLSRGRGDDDVVAAALRGGASVVQLREKELAPEDLLPLARRLAAMCRQAGALFIVNDDPELAAAAGADGVHLGPTDMPPARARAILGPGAIVGWSIKASVEAAHQAEQLGVSYVAVGSIFPTTTKAGATPVGVEAIGQVRAAVKLPVAAIGGINAGNVAPVMAAGADMACVIGAAVSALDVEAACRELIRGFGSAK